MLPSDCAVLYSMLSTEKLLQPQRLLYGQPVTKLGCDLVTDRLQGLLSKVGITNVWTKLRLKNLAFARIHPRLQAERYKCVLDRWVTAGQFIVTVCLQWADYCKLPRQLTGLGRYV